jgi:H+/Cl- antiporter ClcA
MRLPRHFLVFVAPTRWRSHALFVAGGVVVGLAAVLLARLSDAAQVLSAALRRANPALGYVMPPLGFALLAALTQRYLPAAQGSGIPQVMVARTLRDDRVRAELVSLKVAAGKVILLTLGLFAGASIGREGPTVQVGGAIMFAASRLSPLRMRGFVLAGGAAGVAAAFNTPLAGVVFAIEELSRSFEVRTSGLVVTAIVLAGVTSLALVGEYAYFGQTPAALPRVADWLAVPLMGMVGGLAGGVFCRVLALASRPPRRLKRGWLSIPPVARAVICGSVVSLCAWASHGETFGTGYEQARAILHGESAGALGYAPLKFMATIASSLSGIPGGIFAPSLSIGASLGEVVSHILPNVPVGALALLGMTAFLTGVVQAPITAFVIASEMTENHALVIPLMLGAVIAQGAARLVARRGLYHELAHSLLRHRAHRPMPARQAAGRRGDA